MRPASWMTTVLDKLRNVMRRAPALSWLMVVAVAMTASLSVMATPVASGTQTVAADHHASAAAPSSVMADNGCRQHQSADKSCCPSAISVCSAHCAASLESSAFVSVALSRNSDRAPIAVAGPLEQPTAPPLRPPRT